MPTPTEITDIANRAVGRLPDKLKGKPLIEAILRTKSAARIDVITVAGGTLYTPTIDGDPFDYTSLTFDTGAQIADGILAVINTGPANVTAFKRDPSDDYFYIKPKTTNQENTVSVTSNLAWHRIGIIDQLQELETVLFDLLENRSLDTAEGVQLDRIGTIVGLARTGSQSDTDYRASLGVQIRRNLSQGEPETLIEILAALTSSTVVKLREIYPAEIIMTFNGDIVGTPNNLFNTIDSIAAGGVGLTLISDKNQPPFVTEGGIGLGFTSTVGSVPGGKITGKVF